jgi:hypothetical protein
MGGAKQWTLELLAFDEYCRFDTSAFISSINHEALARHGENLRKYTETRARALRAYYAYILRLP